MPQGEKGTARRREMRQMHIEPTSRDVCTAFIKWYESPKIKMEKKMGHDPDAGVFIHYLKLIRKDPLAGIAALRTGAGDPP